MVNVVNMELVSKKVPKSIIPKLRRLQARYMLKNQRRVSEAEIIEEAVERMEKEDIPEIGKRYTVLDLIGTIKGGKRFNAEKELDDIVYGKP